MKKPDLQGKDTLNTMQSVKQSINDVNHYQIEFKFESISKTDINWFNCIGLGWQKLVVE